MRLDSPHNRYATGGVPAGKILYRKCKRLYDNFIDVTMNGLLKSDWNQLPQAKGA